MVIQTHVRNMKRWVPCSEIMLQGITVNGKWIKEALNVHL